VKTIRWPKSDAYAADINDDGVVAGSFVTDHGIEYGFIWTP